MWNRRLRGRRRGPLQDIDGVTIVGGDPAAFVRELKARPGKGIVLMGGGEVAKPLLDGGAIARSH